jgi:hypothetical protein
MRWFSHLSIIARPSLNGVELLSITKPASEVVRTLNVGLSPIICEAQDFITADQTQ